MFGGFDGGCHRWSLVRVWCCDISSRRYLLHKKAIFWLLISQKVMVWFTENVQRPERPSFVRDEKKNRYRKILGRVPRDRKVHRKQVRDQGHRVIQIVTRREEFNCVHKFVNSVTKLALWNCFLILCLSSTRTVYKPKLIYTSLRSCVMGRICLSLLKIFHFWLSMMHPRLCSKLLWVWCICIVLAFCTGISSLKISSYRFKMGMWIKSRLSTLGLLII